MKCTLHDKEYNNEYNYSEKEMSKPMARKGAEWNERKSGEFGRASDSIYG